MDPIYNSLLDVLPRVSTKFGWPWNVQTLIDASVANCLPKISVITPSYNQGQYLEETIRSVILQNYPNYELIVVDAGSTDNTLEVIKKYEPWITHWVSEKDRGQSHAIRKGLALATGDIINWINSDDIVAPGAFYHIAAELNMETQDVICGYCDYFLDNLANLDLRNMRMGLSATVGDTILSHKINQPSTFFKASVIKALDIDEQFHYAMDLDLWYRYLLSAGQNRVCLSDKLLTYFRLHDTSKSVAESGRFEGDIYKVHYNIAYSLGIAPALLAFMSRSIPLFESFAPTKYPVQISASQLSSFIRTYAWRAVLYYNALNNFADAKECLNIARRNGQSMSVTVFRQLVKHNLIPVSLLKWFMSYRQQNNLVNEVD